MSRPRANLRRSARGPTCVQSQRGISLVEAATVVSILGVLLAAFTPTFFKQVRLSKVSEATDQLARMHQATAAYYEQTLRVDNHLRSACLPLSAGPTPVAPSPIPVVVDFASAEQHGHATWRALGLEPIEARFSYAMIVKQPGCGPRKDASAPLVVFRAEGDLDGDGERSLVERAAVATPDERSLTPYGILKVERRVE